VGVDGEALWACSAVFGEGSRHNCSLYQGQHIYCCFKRNGGRPRSLAPVNGKHQYTTREGLLSVMWVCTHATIPSWVAGGGGHVVVSVLKCYVHGHNQVRLIP
jgi:hypothetical protein